LIGLAVGDALGAQVEFMARGSFPPVSRKNRAGEEGSFDTRTNTVRYSGGERGRKAEQ
jgi:hypothetical protein